MKIEKLSLKGFKNLTGDNAWFTLDFRNDYNSTVLIGNNGSGKSNVIEANSNLLNFWELLDNVLQEFYNLSLLNSVQWQLQNVFLSSM